MKEDIETLQIAIKEIGLELENIKADMKRLKQDQINNDKIVNELRLTVGV